MSHAIYDVTYVQFNCLQKAKDIPMLCEDDPSQIPNMYICLVTNVLGQIPLFPCYMDGQKHPTVPYRFRKSELAGAIADSRPDNGTYRFRKSELGGAIADSRPDNGTGRFRKSELGGAIADSRPDN